VEEYQRDVFYDIQALPLKRRIQLLKDVKGLCESWWVDTLDGTSAHRKKVEMGFEEALGKAAKNTLFVFIHRRGYRNWGYYLEAGFRTLTSPDYFLWINADEKEIDGLVKKYKLKVL
jgi:hypothetical protein